MLSQLYSLSSLLIGASPGVAELSATDKLIASLRDALGQFTTQCVLLGLAVILASAVPLIIKAWRRGKELDKSQTTIFDISHGRIMSPEIAGQIENSFPNYSFITSQWAEFREGFVLIDGKYYNTYQSGDFLTDESCLQDICYSQPLLKRFLPIRFPMVSLFPSIATGFGILGTFIGIAIGLGGLAEMGLGGQIDTNAIRNVIVNLSSAFWTSIFGVFIAIALNFSGQLAEDRLLSSLHRFRERLDRLIPRITSESLLNLMNENASDQKAVLDEILEENRESRGHLQELAEEMVDSLGERFNDSLKNHLVPQLSKITDAVSDQVNSSSEMAASEVRRFADEAVQQLSSSLQDSFKSMSQEINGAADRFSGISSNFEEVILQSTQAAKEQSASLAQTAAAAQANSDASLRASEQVNAVQTLATQVTHALSQMGERQQANLDLTSTHATLQRNAEVEITRLATTMNSFQDQYNDVAGNMNTTVGELSGILGSLANNVSSLSVQTQSAAKSVSDASERLTLRTDSEFQLLEKFTEARKQFETAMNTGKPLIAGLSGLINQLTETQVEALEIGEGQVRMQATTADQIEKLVSTLGNFKQSHETVTSLLGNGMSKLENQLQELGSFVSLLGRQTETAASSINQASDSLVQRSNAESQLLDGFNQTSSRFKQAMDASAPVANSLSEVSGKMTQTSEHLVEQMESSEIIIKEFSEASKAIKAQSDSVVNGLDGIRETLAGSSDQVKDVARHTGEWFSQNQNTLNQYRTTFDQAIDSWRGAVEAQLKEFGGQLGETLTGSLHTYDDSLNNAVNSLSGMVLGLTEIAESLEESTEVVKRK